jgi:hypothetical protein
MTLVWGLGLTTENVLRLLLSFEWEREPWVGHVSSILQYAMYGGLTLWTVLQRKQLRRIRAALPAD